MNETATEVTIVDATDWIAIYINGYLVYEGRSHEIVISRLQEFCPISSITITYLSDRFDPRWDQLRKYNRFKGWADMLESLQQFDPTSLDSYMAPLAPVDTANVTVVDSSKGRICFYGYG